MNKDLELKIRRFIDFKRGGLEPENLEEIRETVEENTKNYFSRPLSENFYLYDNEKEAYYKFSCGEGWFFEGVEFDPKQEYLDEEPNIPEYVHSLKLQPVVCFGDRALQTIIKNNDRYILIPAEIFADALIEYIKQKERK
ncbi:MAG: hypothetical protein IJ180_04930 [Bacteroidales bacterium]|nr:hypothetical protein [Bacteroidales bacterium]